MILPSDMAAAAGVASLGLATYYEPEAAPVTVAAAAGLASAVVVPLLSEGWSKDTEPRALAAGLLVGLAAGFLYRGVRRA